MLDLDVIRHGEYGAIPVVEQLIDEIERLLVPLKKIADGWPDLQQELPGYKAQEIARAALHTEGGGDE